VFWKLQNLFFWLVDHVSYNKENDKGGQHDDHNFGGPNIDAAHHKKECAHRFFFYGLMKPLKDEYID